MREKKLPQPTMLAPKVPTHLPPASSRLPSRLVLSVRARGRAGGRGGGDVCPAASLLSEGLQFHNHLEGPGTPCGFLAPPVRFLIVHGDKSCSGNGDGREQGAGTQAGRGP